MATSSKKPLTVTITFGDLAGDLFSTSKTTSALKSRKISPADLIREAARIRSISVEEIVLEGALIKAKTILAMSVRSQGQGVYGTSDEAHAIAAAQLTAAGKSITPARLRRIARTSNFYSAKKWMTRNGIESGDTVFPKPRKKTLAANAKNAEPSKNARRSDR